MRPRGTESPSQSSAPRPNRNRQGVLFKYEKLHSLVIELIFLILLSDSFNSLQEDLTGQYPVQNGKKNYLFILQKYLN